MPNLFGPVPRHDLFGDESEWDTVKPNPLVRSRDPETSHAAAAGIQADGTLDHDLALAFQCVKEQPGSTATELEDHYCVRDGKIRKRLAQLADSRGVIRRGPARKCRVTGKTAQTWEIV